MVAIVAGNGLGLFNASLNTLGGSGVGGQGGGLGQAGGQSYVNASNGNLILRFNDEQLSGLSQELNQLRTYNSQGAINDADGDGWRWDSEKRLSISGLPGLIGSSVTRTTGDGHQTTYAWGLAGYSSTEGPGAHDGIVLKTTLLLFPSEWVWTDGDSRAEERYDLNGRLKSSTNTNGETTTYSYDSAGRMTSVKDSSGQEFVMVYNAAGKLERLDTRTTSGGALTRQVYYAYDSSGRLTSVSTDLTPADNSIADGKVYTTNYSYDGTSFRIAGISQSDGTSVAYTYQLVGSEYRVKTVVDAAGTTTFTYDTANRRTDVSNGLGQLWSYYYDTAGQLTQVLSPAVNGQRLSTSYAYDAKGNVTLITDGAGNAVTYEYDANGNRVLERDALGDTVRRVYSSTNQLLNEISYTQPATFSNGNWTNPPDSTAQVTRYIYDNELNLRFTVDGAGRVFEYRYSSAGLRTAEVRYGDAAYAVSGLSPTATLSESQLNTWVAGRDKTQQQLTEFTYDYRGNLTKSIAYATVNSSGVGTSDVRAQITEYVYSEHGQLLQTIAVRGASRNIRTTLSSTVYDGMGRVLSQVDAAGTRTTVYAGGSRQIAVTNTAGQTITQTYDVRGHLVSISQTAAGEAARTTQYVYDAAGRLAMVQDATGVRSYTLYDEAGRVSARVDGTGALVEYIYSAAGQLTQEKRYAVQLETSGWYNGSAVTKTLVSEIRPAIAHADDRSVTRTYDAAGRLSAVTDGVGAVTSYGYDGRDQLVQIQTGNRVTRTFYDEAGRQLGQLDAEGYLRENRYDSVGQLVQVTRYSVATTEANRASGTLEQLRPSSTGALSTWYYYDRVGRQIGSVDEQGFVTESVVDEELNTVQSLRYATAYTANDISTRAFSYIRTAVSGGSKQSTLTAFDGMGRVMQQTAQDGTVTAFEYDSAGRLVKETAASGTTEARQLTTRYNAFGEVTGRLLGEASARIVPGMTAAQITAIYDQYGLTWRYDTAGRQVSVSDAFGNKTVSYYDEAGRLTHAVNALGEVKESLYNAFGEVKEQTGISARLSAANTAALSGGLNATIKPLVAAIKAAANDNKATFGYDTRGLLTSTTDALGYVTSVGFNAYGEQASLTRSIASGVTSTESYAYNRRGELLSRTEDQAGLNRTTSTTYDAFGRVVSRVDGRGYTTTTTYDLNGRQITVNDPLNQSRSSTYDAWGRVLTETDARGQTSSFSYNDITRTVTIALPEGVTLTTVRNRHGEVASSTDGLQHTTQSQYNKDGQLTVMLDAKGQSSTQAYDRAGRLISVTDVRGSITQYGYDAASRVVTRTDALGVVTRYAFDGQGRQITVTEADGKPEQRVTAYAYDLKGQLLTVTQDPNGLKLTTTYGYDGVGQQVRVARGTTASPDQQVVVYVYDKLGRRTAERQDPTGLNITTQYKYNGNDQVTRTIDARNNSTWYVYDGAGRLTDTVDALGAITRNAYDANGQIISTTRYATAVAPATLNAFATMDQLSSVSPSTNAVLDQVTTFTYDNNGRLKTTIDALGYTESYTYDQAGNRTSLTNKKGDTWHYRYDELNRLSEEITPAVSVSVLSSTGQVTSQNVLLVTSLTYDAAGNVIGRTEGCLRANLAAAPEADDMSQARLTVYLYDAVGRQTFIIAPGAYNKVTGAYQQTGDGTSNTFLVTTEVSYDALGNAVRNRVRVNNAGTAADYVDSYKTYDAAGRVAHEVDALNGVTAYSYDANGHVLTTRRYAKPLLAGSVPSGRVFYLTSDIAARLDTDAANDRTLTMTYDGAGRKTSVQKNLVSLYAYTSDSAVSYVGSPTTLYSYNALGQVTKETQVVRNASGILMEVGASTYRYYDKLGQQVGAVDALGYYTQQEFDVLGQLKRTVEYNTALSSWSESTTPVAPTANANDRRTAYTYDRLGRMTEATQENVSYWKYNPQEQYPLGPNQATLQTGNLIVSKATYDSVGNLVEQRDAANNLTRIEYNALGQIVHVTEPTRATAMAGKANVFEGLLAYVMVGSPKTSYALNAFGQVLSETRSPDTNQAGLVQTSQTRYDAAGHVIQSIDATNAVIDFKIDVAGRRVESRQQVTAQFAAWTSNSGYNQTLRQRYGYDALGQQLFTQDFYSTVYGESFSSKIVDYNRFGEVQSEYMIGYVPSTVLSTTYTATYVYDQAGRITQQQSAQGLIKTEYDLEGRVTRSTQVGDGTTTNPDRVTRTVYDAAGRGTTQYLPRFDANTAANTLTSVTLQSTAPTLQQTYDRWGNVLTRTDQRGFVTTYTYDYANRALTETLPETSILQTSGVSYRAALIHEQRYDALGNVVQEVDWLGPYTGVTTNTLLRTRSHAYNAVGQLTRDIDAIGAYRYYMVDSNGNRVATLDSVGISYAESYDAMDRQLTHSIIRKNAQGVDTQVVLLTSKYDQAGRKYAEIDGATEVEELFGTDRTQTSQRGTVRYSRYDERGNVIQTHNESGIDRYIQFDQNNRKISEVDGLLGYMTWTYNEADYGRLSGHSDLQGRQYTYTYNAFGQLAKESLRGVAALDKTYLYYGNGLLKSITEGVQTYQADGTTVRLQELRTSAYEYDRAGNRTREIDSVKTFLPSTPATIRQISSAETRLQFDELGRLAGMYVPSGNTHLVGAAASTNNYTVATEARIDKITYEFDELGNRRRMTLDTTNQSGVKTQNARWYAYNKEGMVLVGDALVNSLGQFTTSWENGKSIGYSNQYDGAGRLIVTHTGSGDADVIYNGVQYNAQPLYEQTRYEYDDLGHLKTINVRFVVRSSTGTMLDPSSIRGSMTGNVWIANYTQDRMTATYDDRGHVLTQINKAFKPNGTLDTRTDTLSRYRSDGQIIYQTSTNMVTNDIQRTYYNDAGMIDAMGNQRSYRVQVTKASGTGSYTNNYTTAYVRFDGYKASTIAVTTTQTGFTPGTTINTYTERGELMQAAATGTAGFTRQYASNREGMVVSRREASGKIQNYVYYQGGVVASVGNAAVAELSSTLTPIWQNEFEASRPTSYVVGQGDTLARIAQMIWGDSRMWYLIADANGLSQGANDVLLAGDTLKIPTVTTSTQNNATTFKPYNPAEAIGDNTPSPNFPPPPPPPKKKCGGLATIIMVVVAVVAVVVTAGAASAGIGAFAAGGFSGAATAAGAAVASGAAWSGGLAVLGSATTLAGFSAAVIGGAVGSAASQLTGMALGVVDKFSWRQVASGGLTAGAFAGLGGLLSTAQPGSWANTASNALQQKSIVGYSLKGVFSYGTSQAANRVAGLSTSFSWRDLAATMVGSVAAGTISNSSIFNGLNGLPRATVTGQLSALASAKIKDQWFGGGPVNYGQVAADAFGNALGNYVVDILGSNASLPESVQAVRSAGDVALDLGAGLGKLIDQFADERYRADLGLELELAEWDRRAVADERGSIFDFDGPIVASRLGLGGKEGGRNNYISFGAISHFDTKGVNNGLLVREVVGNYRESNDILLNSEQRLARVISLLEARESILLEVGVKYNVDPRAIAGAIAWEFSQNYSGYVSDSLLSPFFQEGYGWGQIHDKTLRQEIMPGVSIVRSFELRNDLNSAIDLIGLRIKNQADRFYQGSGLDLRGSPVASVWLYNTSSEYVSQAAIARHTLIESGSRNIVIDNNMASWLNKNIDIFKFSAPRGSVNVTGGSYSIDIFDGR